MKNIGSVLREIRTANNVSVSELAEGICTPKYVYLIESGKRVPSAYVISQMISKLKYDFYDILPFLEYDEPIYYANIIKNLALAKKSNDIEGIQNELDKLTDEDHLRPEHLQMVMFSRALLLLFRDQDISGFLNTVNKALMLTGKTTNLENVDLSNYSISEFNLLMIYLVYLREIKAYELCIKGLLKIFNSIENVKIPAYYDLQFLLVVDIAFCYLEQEKYDHANAFIIKYQRQLPQLKKGSIHVLYYIKSLCLHKLGDNDAASRLLIVAIELATLYDDDKFLSMCNDLKKDLSNRFIVKQKNTLTTNYYKNLKIFDHNVYHITFNSIDADSLLDMQMQFKDIISSTDKGKDVYILFDFSNVDVSLVKSLLYNLRTLYLSIYKSLEDFKIHRFSIFTEGDHETPRLIDIFEPPKSNNVLTDNTLNDYYKAYKLIEVMNNK